MALTVGACSLDAKNYLVRRNRNGTRSENYREGPCLLEATLHNCTYLVYTVKKTTDFNSAATTCMAINVIVQYNGGLLPDIILLTQCYFHRGTRLNAIRGFVLFHLGDAQKV